MAPSSTACCVTILNQRQQITAHQSNHCSDRKTGVAISSSSNQTKYCTVVENGRVVVKPISSEVVSAIAL